MLYYECLKDYPKFKINDLGRIIVRKGILF